MLRRIKEKFWNMKFRRKLLFSHTMVCVLPIVILGFFLLPAGIALNDGKREGKSFPVHEAG